MCFQIQSKWRSGRAREAVARCWARLRLGVLMVFAGWQFGFAAHGAEASPFPAAILEIEGKVEVSRAGTATWSLATTNQTLTAGDRVRTGERSRAVVRLSEKTMWRLGEVTIIQVRAAGGTRGGFNLLRGVLYFFHRDKPGTFPVETPSAYAVIIGTEFNLTVTTNGATTLNLIDGRVEMTNAFGHVELASGESAAAEPGQPPKRTAALQAANIIQWALYYPGVLDVDELPLADAEKLALSNSLATYRSGNLLAALASYPAGRQPASDAERVYLAALLLAVGKVEGAENELNGLQELQGLQGEAGRVRRLAEALRVVMAAVKFPLTPALSPSEGAREKQGEPTTPDVQLSTLLLAQSYHQQSRGDLEQALVLARRAVEMSPKFGFGWARVAELEFGFGRLGRAKNALAKALELSPRNAEAWALNGFAAAAENRTVAAIGYFDQAIALDGALGNAWLGRGLCRLRRGNLGAGGRTCRWR